jgi:hypothetical protein
MPVNLPQDSQNFSPAGVTSPFAARAMPTRSSDKRLRKYVYQSGVRLADVSVFEPGRIR